MENAFLTKNNDYDAFCLSLWIFTIYLLASSRIQSTSLELVTNIQKYFVDLNQISNLPFIESV